MKLTYSHISLLLLIGAPILVSSQTNQSIIFNPGPTYRCYSWQDYEFNDTQADTSECSEIPGYYEDNTFTVQWYSDNNSNTYNGTTAVTQAADGDPMTLACLNQGDGTCSNREPGFYYNYMGYAITKDVNFSAYDQWIVEFDVYVDTECCPQCSYSDEACMSSCFAQQSSYCGGYQKQWFTVDFIYWASSTIKDLMSIVLWNPFESSNYLGAYAWPYDTYRLQLDAGQLLSPGTWTHVALDFKQLISKYSTVLCHAGVVPDIALDSLQFVSTNTNTTSFIQIKNVYVYAQQEQSSPSIYPTPTYQAGWTPTYCTNVPGNTGYTSGTSQTSYTNWIGATPPATTGSAKIKRSPRAERASHKRQSGVQVAGVNIAGCDFQCDNYGDCYGPTCPTSVGPTQMQHFAGDDHLNIFRIPTGWQYLVNYTLGGTLDPDYMSQYDGIVQACLATGAKCVIDIHNYARWYSSIVGQSNGAVTNDDLVSVWTQLATQYASDTNIVFGIMNEPHDLDMTLWSETVQAVVTAIRNAGASSQWILLPGTDYTSAGDFATASAPYLSSVVNPDGSTTNLMYDVHRYYDTNGTGTETECEAGDHISDSFQPLATYLRSAGRQALLSETGGGNTDSCVTAVCSALSFLNQNSDVYLGWIGWAAGSFPTTYNLTEVPDGSTDTLLVSSCIAGEFEG